MKRMERFLEKKKIFLKKQHREIISREIEDLRRELKKIKGEKMEERKN